MDFHERIAGITHDECLREARSTRCTIEQARVNLENQVAQEVVAYGPESELRNVLSWMLWRIAALRGGGE